MNRREFLSKTSCAAMALPVLPLQASAGPPPMGVIVHSYAHRWRSTTESKAYPRFNDAVELMEHCHEIGAGGLQVMVNGWTSEFAEKVRDKREQLGLYLEGSISLPVDSSDVARFEREIRAAKEAGASILRTVCLSGRRYEAFKSLHDFLTFKKRSIASLKIAEPVVRKHKICLAVENHKDWRAMELVTILKELDSEWVGVNLDFGNNIALMEAPTEVAKMLVPYLMTTHVKDMGVQEYADGFLLSEVPLGQGFLDLAEIITLCTTHRKGVHFNLEMITRDPLKIPCLTDSYWSTFTEVGPADLARTLRIVRRHHYQQPLPTVADLTPEQRLATEEENVLMSLRYSKTSLGLD